MNVENTVKEVSMRIKHYDDVLYKLIRVHYRGLTKEQIKAIKDFVPSKEKMIEMENLAKSIGVKNIVTIL